MIPLISYGMGVESTALLLRFLERPDLRDFDLSDMIVISAQIGNEYLDTKRNVETHVLPRLREHRIRYVQVARAGHLESDGIVVLSDSREPYECLTTGAYKLSDELERAGSVPQYGGEHKCSLKFKVWPLEFWIKHYLASPVRHAFGYNAEEIRRVAKSEEAIRVRVALGYNAEEIKRAERAAGYDRPQRLGWYPLVAWGWTRSMCEDYNRRITGQSFLRSACVFCPFNRLGPEAIERHKAHPAQVADAMLLEFLSLSMNPRGQLYPNESLLSITERSGNRVACDLFTRRLASVRWALYRVRRIYTSKGKAHREVMRLEEGSAPMMVHRLREVSREAGASFRTLQGISYAFLHERVLNRYPSREEFFVAAPALIESKSRYGSDWFDSKWDAVAEVSI